ncbi:hypothetical protein [Phenylobacterium sp.]|uniref:hypothetical protein n=1 Tax=Phenylobacterium sp. TaxID=1871053 RepID=UPI0025F9FD05|nr:hypothetical protein [Phenylobacterium sp.]
MASAAVASAAPPAQVLTLGAGASSCASWQRSAESQAAGLQWIAGYWSGLNAMAEGKVGHSTDVEGLVMEVANVCATEPSLTLSHAVARVYIRLREAGR